MSTDDEVDATLGIVEEERPQPEQPPPKAQSKPTAPLVIQASSTDFDFAEAMPRVTFTQALEMAELVSQKIPRHKIPRDPDNVWLTFQEFVGLFRPDPNHPLRKIHLNEMHDSFDEWDRLNLGALNFPEFEQLARYYNIEVTDEDRVRWKDYLVSFQDFVEWYLERNKNEEQLTLNSVRRYFNKFKVQFGKVTPANAKDLLNFLGFSHDPMEQVMERVGSAQVLTFTDFTQILIPDAGQKFNLKMLNELKFIFEEGDGDKNRVVDKKEFNVLMRYLALPPPLARTIKFTNGAVNFHEFVVWYSKLKPQYHVSLNVLKRRFDEKDPDALGVISSRDLQELAWWFGRAEIAPKFKSLSWVWFEEYVQVMCPVLPHVINIAPMNELKYEYDRASGGGNKTYPTKRMSRMCQMYGLDGRLLTQLVKETINFHMFVQWYCDEIDLVVYKQKFDEFNDVPGEEMSKDTFKKILTQFQIKLTPMERNEIFADSCVVLEEFVRILKSRDIEFMQIPEDPKELLKMRMSKLSLSVVKERFDEKDPGDSGRSRELTFGQAQDLARHFCVTPPTATVLPHVTFAEFAAWVLDDPSNPALSLQLNELKAAFDEYDDDKEGRLAAGSIQCTKLAYYLRIPCPTLAPQFESEQRISFHDIVLQLLEQPATFNLSTMNFSIFKRRFDEFDKQRNGRLNTREMTDLCHHFNIVFDPSTMDDEPYYFHEFLTLLLPDAGLDKGMFNDVKRTFDSLCPDAGHGVWQVEPSMLSDAMWYYAKPSHPPATVDPVTNKQMVTFHDFYNWVASDLVDVMYANLNILCRRFDEHDIHSQAEVSIDDCNEVLRFFNRPGLAAQDIEGLDNDIVTFLEFVGILLGKAHPYVLMPLNELKRQFGEYSPEEERISSDCLKHASEYFDVEYSKLEGSAMDGTLTFQELCFWLDTQKRIRPPLNPRIPSINVLQKRFNFSIDRTATFAYAKLPEAAAISLCRFFGEDLSTITNAATHSPNGWVMFHELVRVLLEDKDQNPIWHLKLNDLKLLFEHCDRDAVGKLTLFQFEEAAHMLDFPLQSFQDAKEAEKGLTFSAFIAWVVKNKPEVAPRLDLTMRRRYNNSQPNFNSLRKRFNQIDEMEGFLTIEKTKDIVRFFDLDVRALAEARSLYDQEAEGVAEEDREPKVFQNDLEAFTYLLPPPVIDEDGVEHPIELTFQDFCHMTFYPTDIYFEVDTMNELKDLFEVLESKTGDEGVITQAMFFKCLENYYLSEEERDDLNVVNGLISFNEFVRKLGFAPKSFLGFALKQSRKKGRECMGGCVIA